MSKRDYLKPCPFCGTEQQQDWETGETIPYTNQSRSCHACGCSTHDWNTRPIEDALKARIAELLDEINSLKKYKAESESVISKAKDLLGDEMGEWLPVDPVYLPERLQQLRQVLYILEGLEKGA